MDTRSIQEQAVSLANRTYWDTFGAESESLTLEQKLVNLGTFVHRGGNIADVVNLYVERTDDESRLDAVQWMVFSYLEYMINAGKPLEQPYRFNPTAQRIMRLNREDVLELLQRELQRCCDYDPVTDKARLRDVLEINDKNLDAIERRHWREHPDESFWVYLDRWRRWDRRLPGLWRKDVKNR